jgi:hypothetical protein
MFRKFIRTTERLFLENEVLEREGTELPVGWLRVITTILVK